MNNFSLSYIYVSIAVTCLLLLIFFVFNVSNKEENSNINGNKPFQPLVFTVGENPTDFIQRMKNIRNLSAWTVNLRGSIFIP